MSAIDNNDIPVDQEDEVAAEPLLLPLDSWHRARGARMVEFAGYQMPVQYEGIIAEHLWTRQSAGLFDVSHMGQLIVSAEEGGLTQAAAALEKLLPGDISSLKAGRLRYSLLLNDAGGILDDLMISNRGEDYYLVVNGATKWDDIAHLREHLDDEITLTHLDDSALLALQGPKAAGALRSLGITPATDGGPSIDDLKFMQAGPFDWNGKPLAISRSGYTGEDGFEISVLAQDVEALADALCAQPEVKPIGLGARDSLRLEAGLPLYGHDLSPETDPIAAGLGFAISKARRAEGNFPGADKILTSLREGTPAKRVGLAIDGRLAAREGALVMSGEKEVGRVTSGGFSPSLEHPIAMAYIETGLCETGTRLEIESRGRRIAATVTTMPFVAHRYHR